MASAALVVEQARAYQRAGGSSLRGFLDWIERQVVERARAVESPAPESDEDCVRIMTIHAAKGLEFPVVVLTGFGSTPNRNADNVIVDRTSGRAEIQLTLSGGIHVPTPGMRPQKVENQRRRKRRTCGWPTWHARALRTTLL